jgi:hypothetical protein
LGTTASGADRFDGFGAELVTNRTDVELIVGKTLGELYHLAMPRFALQQLWGDRVSLGAKHFL